MSTPLRHINSVRVVSLVPTSQGTGYAIVECPPLVVIERAVLALPTDRGEHIMHLSKFLAWYRPNVLLLEDMHSEHFRRRAKTRVTIETVIGLASGYGIAVRPVSREEVLAHFELPETVSKSALAQKVADSLPELAKWVPQARRLWETEPYWMPMFEAMALVLTAFKAE